MITSTRHPLLTPAAAQLLAVALGERPETAAVVNALRWDNCVAYTLGDPAHLRAAIVEITYLLGEPFIFAADAASLWALLQAVTGWDCVLAEPTLAQELGHVIHEQTGKSVRYYADIGYTLPGTVDPIHHPAVRLLTLADLPLLDQWLAEPVGLVRAKIPELLTANLVAGAVVNGELVATACADAPHGHYAEIGIETQAAWRGQGFAAATASLVIQTLQAANRIPVWSTGEDNQASQRVAQKLGFVETFRRLYVIPEGRS